MSRTYNDLTADYVTTCSNNVAAAARSGLHRLAAGADERLPKPVPSRRAGSGAAIRGPISTSATRKKQMSLMETIPQFVTLDFQLGRYLMISGSRPGSQPLNLQGKWNDLTSSLLGQQDDAQHQRGDELLGRGSGNLSECTLPLFDMMQDLSVTGQQSPRLITLPTSAWVAHHDTDLWRGAAPCNGIDGVWPTGGGLAVPACLVALPLHRRHQLAGHERLSADERRGAIFPGFFDHRPVSGLYHQLW